MFVLLSFATRKYFLDTFPGAPGAFADLFSILISLSIYWYTAAAFGQAFGDRFPAEGTSYFQYVLVGEFALVLPQALFFGVARATRASLIEGTFDFYRLLPSRFPFAILALGLGSLAYESAKLALTVWLAYLAFGFAFPADRAFGFILLQAMALPIFLGLGTFAAGLFLFFGRGTGFLSQIMMVAELLAGVYFPISLLPGEIERVSAAFSPFTFVVSGARAYLSGSSDFSWWNAGFGSALWGVVLLGSGVLCFGFALAKIRKTGAPVLPLV